MRFLTGWSSGRQRWARVAFVLSFLGIAAAVVCWRNNSLVRVTAAPPSGQSQPVENRDQAQVAALQTSDNYADRVVGYIYGTTKITREQLGDYLIARYGPARLETLVNKMIIEHECRQQGIDVTAAEVDASFDEDSRQINVNRKEFVEKVLKQRKVTEFEWREDVIRPRLLLTKYCQKQVQVTPEDLKKIYDAYHGEKVQCQMIMWPQNERQIAYKVWDEVRKSEEAFDRYARSQASAMLARCDGMLDPFGRNATGNESLEKIAFGLQPKEVSHIIETPEGWVVLRLIKKLPPDGVKLEEVRSQLEKEMFEKKVQQEIPKVFKEMRDRADPKLFLKSPLTERDLTRSTQQLLGAKSAAATLAPPQGH